jgi:hypothetical protein
MSTSSLDHDICMNTQAHMCIYMLHTCKARALSSSNMCNLSLSHTHTGRIYEGHDERAQDASRLVRAHLSLATRVPVRAVHVCVCVCVCVCVNSALLCPPAIVCFFVRTSQAHMVLYV